MPNIVVPMLPRYLLSLV